MKSQKGHVVPGKDARDHVEVYIFTWQLVMRILCAFLQNHPTIVDSLYHAGMQIRTEETKLEENVRQSCEV